MASISRLNGRIVDLERFVVRMGIQHIAAILLQLLPVPPQCSYNHCYEESRPNILILKRLKRHADASSMPLGRQTKRT